jgi:arginine N-succinyltransferase
MLFIRPSKKSDIDSLLTISARVGSGMTSMPNCAASWEKKLHLSDLAFNNAQAPEQSCYFMVLEDSETGNIAGTTAIYTGLGLSQPFYSYQRSTVTKQSDTLNKTKHSETLTLVEHFKGASEVGSLFLLPEYRKPGVGQMLARSRYLLMADSQHRFSDRVMAELRGWMDEDDKSPLWQALGSKFFDMHFQEAVTIAATQGPDFITELMPKHPIYTELLPKAARAVLSKPNDSSAPALRMLEKEGFAHQGFIDLFDGGPSVEAQLQNIKTVKESQLAQVKGGAVLTNADQDFYVSNADLQNFSLTMAKGRLTDNGTLLLSDETLKTLDLTKAQVRYVPVMSSKKASQQAA